MTTASLSGGRRILEHERTIRRRAFAPPPHFTLSQWSDARRILSREGSAEPGRWRTDRAPFLREIMDACSDPAVERTVFMKPAQIGGTEVANNFCGYFIDQDPSPVLVVQPTVDVAKLWSKERLDPMLRDTPCLRGKVNEGNRREKDQSIQRKVFPGGYLAVIGANSATGLRSRPVRAVLADEVDAYPQSAKGAAKKDTKTGATGEGDPLSLAIKRTTTFWNRKIFEVSTPTDEDTSRIDRDYKLSDMREYEVPCPHCGYRQTLKWSNVSWESGNPDSAVYLCGEISKDGEVTAGCGAAIPEYHKSGMLRAGQWIARRPGRKIRGYWINALYSPWLTWSAMAQEWLDAQDKPEELKVFINTRLAEVYRGKGDAVNEDVLKARREPFGAEAPAGVGLLTAAVDVQGDRLELAVKGWGKGRENWTLLHEQLWGDPAKQEVWDRLSVSLGRSFRHESGATLQVRWTFVDSGGHHTSEVYRYCKVHRSRNVYASKGQGEPGKAPVGRPSKSNKGKVALFPLGTIALKDAVFAMLRTDTKGPGYVHLAHEITDEYIRQLTSERRVMRYVYGRPSHTYILPGGRANEGLDLECMAYAAYLALGPIGERAGIMADEMMAASQAPAADSPLEPTGDLATPSRRQRGSGWVNRWRPG